MALYLDTSALVKLYVSESGSDQVLAAVRAESVVVISSVGYAEARSALARTRLDERLSDDEYRQAVVDLDHDWSTFVHIDVVNPLPHRAGHLAATYALRGFDAIHLASALYGSDAIQEVAFLAFDDRLNAAAEQAGLSLYAIDHEEA